MSKTISSQKRRRHSTEPSPGKSQGFSVKPSSKKLITDNEFKTVTMSKQSQPPDSNPSTQSNQSIFTDNDVNRLAQAATKNIRNIPDLHGIGISQDLTKARSRVASLAREAVRKGKLKSTSVWDGKIFLTAINDDKRIVSTESELKDFINGNQFQDEHLDILRFTETWLKPDVLLDNFVKPFRYDRVERVGGEVAVHVKSYLSAKRRCDLEVNGVESVWLELKLKQNRPFLLGTFYRPPNSPQHLLNLIEHSFDLASDTCIETILIVGDFDDDQMNPRQSKMKEIFTRYGMTQFVEEPTNFCENSASVIDLVLSNNSNAVDLVHVG
ncbi:unnamed protein product [Mytilus coruscus]|uniref:Endonuclease/exonuclease/phosphatase domain-containing protein n=1 Tax=Mytilus coruscus TaxID=42192 RepID=A0A6J8E8T1_MYTCO|nr:unnamed protein product [Mytilus coruscus]